MSEPPPPADVEPDVGPDDPASSLRAVALLTLKRRKPTDGLPQRPTNDDPSVQLDYGQDDLKESPNDVDMPLEGQYREEGEISDSEDPALKASKAMLAAIKSESPAREFPVPSLSPGEVYLDPDHVRPGLSMNQEQYDTAKDIVLDLLGWGVPPHYLVDCNLSREIVYYVFTELNLRLPHNLDVTGLIQYTPAIVAKHSRPLLSTQTSARSITSAARPLHPSLPAKPLVGPAGSSHSSPPRTDAQPVSTLHDIERQRRQELLARKAVQASRKIKLPSDTSSTASSSHVPVDSSDVQDQDVEMSPAVATEAVDDFLKTIGEKSPTPEVDIKPEPTDAMDIDDIPRVGDPTEDSPSNGATASISMTDQADPTQSPPQHNPASSSGELQTFDDRVQQRSSHRRGVKRPTAADFVDFDSGSRNGHHGPVPPLKRKTASFASVSGHRKLVIDLSDSEGGDDYAMQDVADTDNWEGGSGYLSPIPGRAGFGTPPVAPASLVEKEEEIRKMRELIAQREKSRLQRAMSRPTPADSGREDSSIDGSNGLHASDSGTRSATATPPHIDSEGSATTNGAQDSIMPETDSVIAQDTQEPATGLVDVDLASSSSAQAQSRTTTRALPRRGASPPEERKYNHYVTYDSLLSSYPHLLASASCSTSSNSSLSSSSIPSASLSISSLPSASTSSTAVPLPSLKPLKLATCRTLDPTKRICQYEVPGGGVCRDAGCQDVHLGQAGIVEPTDAETVEYLGKPCADVG
ncbi:hypothetical protein C8F01DRAFT_1113918 [Mycena amicta]|nr:hypothetical protein C8F01DRAFT_1113918 [Mycena amicta]